MNGVLVIDKPAGMTSHDVVQKVRKVSGIRKAGHTGTLDPLATGVLPVCLNEATKLVQFLANDGKQYRATLLLGVRTDTLDTQGKVLSREEPRVDKGQIEAVFRGFIGKRTQVAPKYSAVKVRGRALYDWARRGMDVLRPEREVEIYTLHIEEITLPEVVFTIGCSKGSYIRSFCAEIGDVLGPGGCMSALCRTQSGMFGLESAVSLEDLLRKGWEEAAGRVIPLADLLPGLPLIEVDETVAGRLKNGWQPVAGVMRDYHIPFLVEGDVVKIATADHRLVAVARALCTAEGLRTGEATRQVLKILRIFND